MSSATKDFDILATSLSN